MKKNLPTLLNKISNRSLIASWLFILLFSCNTTVDHPIPETEVPELPGGLVSGRIIIPKDAKIDTTELSLISTNEAILAKSNSFELDTIGLFNTIYLTNNSDQIILVGYLFLGSETNDISVDNTKLLCV